jgi:hypothetical protein
MRTLCLSKPSQRRQVNEAAHEEPGDNEQHDRKRNLSDDERSGQRATRCGRRTAAPILECRRELNARRAECRQHAEQKRRYHRGPSVKPSTGMSGVRFNGTGSGPGVAMLSSTALAFHASATPAAAPRKASNRDSVRS